MPDSPVDVDAPQANQTSDVFPIKEVKTFARSAFRSNLVNCAIVSVLGAVLFAPLISPSAVIATSYHTLTTIFHFFHLTPAEAALSAAKDTLNQIQNWTSVGDHSSAGVISTVYHSVKTSGSIENAVIYALGRALFRGSVSASIIAGLALLVTLALTLMVRFPLHISSLRFYLETRAYPATHVSRLLFIFRHRRVLRIAWAGIYKYFWLIAWALTLVMAPVKYYSYLMYDYILAENPDANPRDVLKLSQAMMKGNRWHAFLLDLNFLPWYLLGLVTFGLSTYFYASPYHSLARADLYIRLRERAKAGEYVGIEAFTDPYLASRVVSPGFGGRAEVDGEATGGGELDVVTFAPNTYPDPHAQLRIGSHEDYKRDYSVMNLVLLFFIFSFIGWAYESVFSLAYVGRFINRGTMYGPWIPIYGTGGTAALVLLRKVRDHPLMTFCLAAVISGIFEYVSATIIYNVSGLEYWSYAGYFFNIQGRVCLEGLLVFGMGCLAAIYFIAPILDTWLNRIPLRVRRWIVVILIVAFLIDGGFTLAFPRVGFGITS